MAGIARVISFIRGLVGESNVADVVGDPGGAANKTYQHAAPAGDDSQPLDGDYIFTTKAPGTGRENAVGYQDPKNAGIAEKGEKRIYSRDPVTGEVVASFHLKNSGEIVGSNAKGTMTMSPDGIFTVDVDTAVILNADDVRIGNLAGQAVARVGDLVAVTIPSLLTTTPGLPVTPVPPTAVTPTGGYVAAGQIISGSPRAKA